MSALVTIGVPTYNTPIKYFDLLIQQLINQTYTNLDILIVDDGSEDAFVAHLKDVKKLDKRIRLILKNNTGVYDTRSLITANIQGEYFTFVDSDDYIPAGYIEAMLQALRGHEADCVFSFCKPIKFEGETSPLEKKNDTEATHLDRPFYRALVGELGHYIWGRLLPRKLIADTFFDPALGFDDAQCVLEVCRNASSAILVHNTNYFYRQRAGSVMHSGSHGLYSAYLTFVFYLDMAKKSCLDATPYLENMVALSELKLCCVDYGEGFTSSVLKEKSKLLRKSVGINGFFGSKKERAMMFLGAHFPRVFRYLFVRKRRKLN